MLETRAVFTDSSAVPTVVALRASLFVGAADVARFPPLVYTRCITDACNASPDVVVYFKGSGGWDEHTVFELPPRPTRNETAQFLINVEATVRVGQFTFRNPPSFYKMLSGMYTPADDSQNNFWKPPLDSNPAYLETEEVLNSCYYF